MSREIFVDTSAWIMLINSSEKNHGDAKKRYGQLAGSRLAVTNLVISETYTWLRKKAGAEDALKFLNVMQQKTELGQLEVFYSDPGLEEEAVKILSKYRDHDFSYPDAVSFALMKKRNIKKAFAYDSHFITAGFNLVNKM